MSSNDVDILSTKLDILIDDFKAAKKFAIGFVVVVVIPITTFLVMKIVEAQQHIAVLETTVGAK